MRKIRDVLRLNAEGLSNRKIAVSLGIGRTTIGDTVRRAKLAGLNWPLPSDLTDDALEQRLFPVVVKAKNPSLPDWAYELTVNVVASRCDLAVAVGGVPERSP